MPDLISYPFTSDALEFALASAGSTDSAIATVFLGMECFGVRGSDCHCPTAVFVKKAFPDAVKAEVFLEPSDEAPYVVATDADGIQVDAYGPPALGWFIRRFDFGQHPELEVSHA